MAVTGSTTRQHSARDAVQTAGPRPGQGSDSAAGGRDRSSPDVEVFGRITQVRFYNPDTGAGVVVIDDPKLGRVALRGTFTFVPAPGRNLSASAHEERHPKFGRQLVAPIISAELPTDKDGLIAYLAEDLAAVDARMATRLVSTFGPDLLGILRDEPGKVLAVPGMSNEAANKLRSAYEADRAARAVWSHLARNGVTGSAAAAVFRKFGASAADVVRRRPYDLAVVPGMTFQSIDRLS